MSSRRSVKRALILDDDEDDVFYSFKVLLPNQTSVKLTINNPEHEMSMVEFVNLVEEEYDKERKDFLLCKRTRVDWNLGGKFCVESNGEKMKGSVRFAAFKPNLCHIIRLDDGSGIASTMYENLWDLTPDTDLLKEIPENYSFETALADLIDNSLQAVWSCRDKRMIRVDVSPDRISVFDTGSGMDSSEENSIDKWGKIGASLHRSHKTLAIGGKPPYLKPFFGMFGYGGPYACMNLGRRTLVSSKTKESKKVFTLQFKKEALIENQSISGNNWKTAGGMRDPTEEEIKLSPHGSFTKVEIFESEFDISKIYQLQCRLKDIYFPYIQCDELSKTGKTERPVEFQVNGEDLAEITGGEVAITNLNSKGQSFSFQIRFSLTNNKRKGYLLSGTQQEANARLKFVYFPIIQGKESIDKILESLEEEGCKVSETFRTFGRVSIRRLGRLLPEVRWESIPFMQRGHIASTLQKCSQRVKCFIDLDAGFNPTPSKTDLASQNPFSKALRNFGSKSVEKEKENDVDIVIHREEKSLSYAQLDHTYQEWVLNMHNVNDEEATSGDDDAVLIVGGLDKKGLCIIRDAVRVHKVVTRKGTSWKRGQNIKILKGAYAGVHSNNVYATIDYFLIEGFEDEVGGDTRILCRPINLPEKDGCKLSITNGVSSIDLKRSLSLPISVIDSGKCIHVDAGEWNKKQQEKEPSKIVLLDERDCRELNIDDGKCHIKCIKRFSQTFSNIITVSFRVGSFLPPIHLSRFDEYGNRIMFGSLPNLKVELEANTCCLYVEINKFETKLVDNGSVLSIENMLIETDELDQVRPDYKATLQICCKDKPFCVSVECKVSLGPLERVSVNNPMALENLLPCSTVENFTLEMFDEYNNHVAEGTDVLLRLDGYHLDDLSGVNRKVDYRGCVDLSGILKVTQGYGKSVSISVVSGNEEIFKKESQVEERELKLVTKLPDRCAAGSNLVNLIFVVADPNGTVDASIHHDEKSGCFHTMTIESDSSSDENDASVRYTFVRGSCKVPVLSLPENAGVVSFKVLHSRYPELHVNLKVSINLSSPLSTSERDEICFSKTTTQTPQSKMASTKNQSATPSSQVGVLAIRETSLAMCSQTGLMDIAQYSESLKEKVDRYDQLRVRVDARIKSLETELEEAAQEFSSLQASLEPLSGKYPECLSTKDAIMTQIEQSHPDTAASVFCHIFREAPQPQSLLLSKKGIFGLVALLGSVPSTSLSRVLSEYLGKDTMLALVCKSSSQFGPKSKEYLKLQTEAAKLGRSINKRFLVICLDATRLWSYGLISNDPQKRLSMDKPYLPNGDPIPGFIDYAVNMINISPENLNIQTSSGHGIRETLFYHAFKKLQVYETGQSLESALPYIDGGDAVSLDGVVARRRNGVSIYSGCCLPEVCFPITVSEKEKEDLVRFEKARERKRKAEEMIVEESFLRRKLEKKLKKVAEKYQYVSAMADS
ncbi:unnamed protein product [Cochlearia groenlandica]